MVRLAPLPVDEIAPEIFEKLDRNQVVLLTAETGSGKTTRLPIHLLDHPLLKDQKIFMLEPRRIAARQAAARIAKELGEEPGKTIGYAMRFERKTGPDTRFTIFTEGTFIQKLQADPELKGVGLVILDEFHERSVDGDLALALLLEIQDGLREDLKILIMSATLAGGGFNQLLPQAAEIHAKGRLFPIKTCYRPKKTGQHLEDLITETVREALWQTNGDCLIFLPGWREIRKTMARLEEFSSELQICPLHGSLSLEEQRQAIQPGPKRKLVLATDIAETSLTIEGVTAVIDTGLMRKMRYQSAKGMGQLITLPVTKASAEQRKGRAGRVQAGTCYRLWSEAEDRTLTRSQAAEILFADLAPLALELACWGSFDLPWLTPPSPGAMKQAQKLLINLNILDTGLNLTAHGREVKKWPLHPRLAHMIIKARAFEGEATAINLAAILSSRDFLSDSTGADLSQRVQMIGSGKTPYEFRQNLKQLYRIAGNRNKKPDPSHTGSCLALAFPERIGRRKPGTNIFYLTGGQQAELRAQSGLEGHEWIVAADIEQMAGKNLIRLGAALRFEEIEGLVRKSITISNQVRVEPSAMRIENLREEKLGAITLKTQISVCNDEEKIRQAWHHFFQNTGLDPLMREKTVEELVTKMAFAHSLDPERWPDVTPATLKNDLVNWLIPFTGAAQKLSDIDVKEALLNLLSYQDRSKFQKEFPSSIDLPLGTAVIDYGRKPPVVQAVIQSLFGLTRQPAIAGGRVSLAIELLSPARRPVQITSDLQGFWQHSYMDVRKDLRGRYPKHPWPDDPAQAQPWRPGLKRQR